MDALSWTETVWRPGVKLAPSLVLIVAVDSLEPWPPPCLFLELQGGLFWRRAGNLSIVRGGTVVLACPAGGGGMRRRSRSVVTQ